MDEIRQEIDFTICEPCFYFSKTARPATKRVGWDDAPVCDWHAQGSWSSPAKCGKKTYEWEWVKVERLCENSLPCDCDLTQRHLAHYEFCNCLADSGSCCQESCPCKEA